MINLPPDVLRIIAGLAGLARGLSARLGALEKALNPTGSTAGPPHVYIQSADPVGTYTVVDGDVWISTVAAGGVKVRVTGAWVTAAS